MANSAAYNEICTSLDIAHGYEKPRYVENYDRHVLEWRIVTDPNLKFLRHDYEKSSYLYRW